MRISLNQIWDRYQVPVMIVENGFGAIDVREGDGSVHDQGRIDYMRTHIEQLRVLDVREHAQNGAHGRTARRRSSFSGSAGSCACANPEG